MSPKVSEDELWTVIKRIHKQSRDEVVVIEQFRSHQLIPYHTTHEIWDIVQFLDGFSIGSPVMFILHKI